MWLRSQRLWRRPPVLTGIAIGMVLCLVAVTVPFAGIPVPQAALLVTVTLVLASTAWLATFFVVIGIAMERPRISTVTLAFAYGTMAFLSAGHVGSLPFGPGTGPLLPVGPDTAGLFFSLRQLVFPFIILWYVAQRRRERGTISTADLSRALAFGVVASFVIVSLMTVLVLFGGSHLNLAQNFTTLHPFWRTINLFLTAPLLAFTAVCVWRIRRPSILDWFLVLTLVDLAAESFLSSLSAQRFVLGWYVGHFAYFWASLFMLFGVTIMLLRTLGGYTRLHQSFLTERRRAQAHEHRLAVIHKVAGVAHRAPSDVVRSILNEAASLLRPSGEYFIQLLAIEDDRVLIELTLDRGDPRLAGVLMPERSDVPILAGSIIAELADGETHMWNDFHSNARHIPWRSMVATPFTAGQRHYAIVFGSLEVENEPYSAQDVAFVEVVAKLCASQIKERDARNAIAFAARHDALTGLANRTHFRSRLVGAIAAGPGVVAIVDITGFADINRSLGQLAGDAILVEFGAALAQEARPDELVARLGDDNFGLLLAETDAEETAARLEAFRKAVERPLTLGDGKGRALLDVHARIGCASFPRDGRDVETVFARAFAAVDMVRSGGSTGLEFFDPLVDTIFARRRALLGDMRVALDERQFELHYQPTVDLVSGRIIGAEALVRWRHPTRGLLCPADFIPLAIEARLVGQIGQIVLDEAIANVRSFAAWLPSVRLFVNLSMDQLHDPAFAASVLAKLEAANVPASMIGLEVTESMAMQDVDATQSTLAALRAAGIQIALDDFGTGYSSLAYLKQLPLDKIKIDQSFVRGLPAEERDCALVDSMLSIGRNFGLSMVAEGIESPECIGWLIERGCREAQGYLFSRPLDRDAFVKLLEAQAPKRLTA